MKIVIIVLLIVGVCGNRKKKEVDLEKFYATFDPELSVYSAKKFDFPKEKELDFRNTPVCRDFKKFPNLKDSCSDTKGIDYSGDLVSDCKERKCIQKSFYGSTKCKKVVRLFKPFLHAAVECKKMHASCGMMKPHDHEESPKDGKPHLYPEPPENKKLYMYPKPEPTKDEDDEEISCGCYTIWCFRDIQTIYEENRKLYKGNVVIKTPCGCDCRKAWGGGHGGGGR